MLDTPLKSIQADYLNALIKGDRTTCYKILKHQLNQGTRFEDVYEQIVKEALYEVGKLWELHKISVATEHLATALTESILSELYSYIIANKKNNFSIIASCVEEEEHQVGIKMVCDVFESNGWNSYFLGANTPTKDLISFAHIINPTLFALSLSIFYHLPTLEQMIQLIRIEFPNTPILVGGQAFTRGGKETIFQYTNVFYLEDLYSINSFIKNYV